MALPIVKTPTFTLKVPSTGQKIDYRPFLAKEEKILLMAKEGDDAQAMTNAVKDTVNACTFGKVNSATSPTFDLEYIFINLRARAVGEVAEVKFKCTKEIKVFETGDDFETEEEAGTKECGGEVILNVNFLDIDVHIPDNHTTKIIVDEEQQIGIELNYPCLEMSEELSELSKEDFDRQMVILCKNIYDKNNVYPATESTREELIEFFENLSRPVYTKIKQDFFDSMPTMQHKVEYKCPKCGHEDTYTFKGIHDFF